jgi:tetratricopeptide (TPR) repeat protein
MTRVLLPLLLIAIGCKESSALTPFDEADSMIRDLGRARELYRKAAATDPDPRRRDKATIRVARIDWHVFHDAASARATLAKVPATSAEAAQAALTAARFELSLARDYGAARAAAERALKLAKEDADRNDAHLVHAEATIEEARQARLAGRCPADGEALRAAMLELQGVIDTIGPLVDPARLLLNGALMSGDDATVLQAWRWYYADVPSAVPASIPARRELGHALAKARLFEEAELVLRDPCAPAAPDAASSDVLAYAASVRRVRALAEEHHRAIARGTNDDSALRRRC